MDISRSGLLVATGRDSLLVKQVHPESSKAMDASSFAAGHKIVKGSRLF
jgi:methionyl-tRNA formyltransferase